MTYIQLKEAATKYDYKFPIVADDEYGNQIVINEGEEGIFIEDVYTKSHYFQVYTYYPEGVRIHKYYDMGVTIEVNPNL